MQKKKELHEIKIFGVVFQFLNKNIIEKDIKKKRNIIRIYQKLKEKKFKFSTKNFSKNRFFFKKFLQPFF